MFNRTNSTVNYISQVAVDWKYKGHQREVDEVRRKRVEQCLEIMLYCLLIT